MKLWKHIFYWTGYLVFLVAGMALSHYRRLPVRNTFIFLFSLIFMWNSLSGILRLNPHLKVHSQRYRNTYCMVVLSLGLLWLPLSLLPQSHEAIPVLAISLPFLTIIATAYFCLERPLKK